MAMSGLNHMSAVEAAAAIAEKKLTSVKLVEACLARIDAREAEVGAWAHVDYDGALNQARLRDSEHPRGPLHGIPVGVKDVIDSADMPTEYGSPIYKGHQPKSDAACVALARSMGAIILGKTVTGQFATREPGKTRNPLDLACTPGGSSMGSAAAVADYMVPLAFGTQTTASIIRPASYCGVVGYKPTFNTINRAGMKFMAESLDTIGVFARNPRDAALLAESIGGLARTSFEGIHGLRPRIGFCRTPNWSQATEETRTAFEEGLPRLERAGATVSEVELPEEFSLLNEAHLAISTYEYWRALAYERTKFADRIAKGLMQRLEHGGRVTRDEYEDAQNLATRCRATFDVLATDCDVLLVPSAPTEAPRDLTNTGNGVFGIMWSVLHGPCLSIPAFKGPNGLPVGAQIIGRRESDGRTLLCAEWIQHTLCL